MKHLVIQTAFLGDLLLSIPLLRQIRAWSPRSTVVLCCRKGYGSFVEKLGVCDEVIELDKKNRSSARDLLSQNQYDTIFSVHQSWSTHQLVSQLKAKHKVGYSRWWNRSYFDSRVERHRDWPEAMRQLQLLGAVSEEISLKLEIFENNPEKIPLWAQMKLNDVPWTDRDKDKLWRTLLGGVQIDSFICLAPGSVWETKRWPLHHWQTLAQKLVQKNQRVVLIGAPEEEALCRMIVEQVPGVISLAGRLSVVDSLMVLSESKGLVCNDSGAMHMSSLLGLRTLALFGPTVPQMGYIPWNIDAKVMEQKDLLCRPCGQHGGRVCPIGTHSCMEDISPAAVYSSIMSW